MGNQSKLKKFECLFCSQRFRLQVQLESHINFHTQERPYFCPDCDHGWPSRHALYRHHVSVHQGIQYKCNKCRRIFPTYERFRKHRQSIHKARPKDGRHSIKAERIRVNETPPMKKNISPPVLEPCLPSSSSSPPPTSVKPARRFTSVFSSLSPVIPQRVLKRRATCPLAGSQCLDSSASSPPILATENPVVLCNESTQKQHNPNLEQNQCLFCNKVFSGYHKLESHMASHTRERFYFCKESGCDTTWPTADALYRHKQIVHRGIKYRCSACLRLFNSYDGFRKHRRDHHDGKSKMVDGKHTIKGEIVKMGPESLRRHRVRPRKPQRPKRIPLKTFDCLFCIKKFREMRQLEMHMNRHTGEMPHVCVKCDAWYDSRFGLYKHYRSKEHKNALRKTKVTARKEEIPPNNEALHVDPENEGLDVAAEAKADVVVDSAEEASDTDTEDPLIHDATLLYDVAKWIASIHGKENPEGII